MGCPRGGLGDRTCAEADDWQERLEARKAMAREAERDAFHSKVLGWREAMPRRSWEEEVGLGGG